MCLHVEIVCALTSEFLLSWKTLPLPPAALVRRSRFHFSPNSVSGLCQGLGSGLSVQARAPAVWSALEAGLQHGGLQARDPTCRPPLRPYPAAEPCPYTHRSPFSVLGPGAGQRWMFWVPLRHRCVVSRQPAHLSALCLSISASGMLVCPPRSLSPQHPSFSPAIPKPGPPPACVRVSSACVSDTGHWPPFFTPAPHGSPQPIALRPERTDMSSVSRPILW